MIYIVVYIQLYLSAGDKLQYESQMDKVYL